MPLKVACTCQQSDWLSTHDGLNTRVARSPESTVLPCQHNFSVRVPERGSLAKHTARLAREIEVIMRVRELAALYLGVIEYYLDAGKSQ